MEENNDFSYIGYQEMIADITTALDNTEEVMNELELPNQAAMAKEASEHIKSHIFSVGIMGEFKRGKSTVINALLGEEIAPADIVPASATLNRITYGLAPKATILYKDGKKEEIPVDKIADYITKITEESEATAELVDQAIVEYPCQFCKNNVEIIDTPGLNDDERMDAISEAVIPKLDAVVLVLSANSPFSMSEAEFVRTKLMTSDVTRLIVIVNRIDTIYGERDRQRIVESIREKIIREVLDRTAAIHGEDSKLYQDTKDKLADMKLYPLSAIQALIGRTENNPELVEQSGILAFEERLRKLLTEERGVLEILKVAGSITALLKEGESAITMRMNALEMTTEEFLQNQKEAEEKIETLRKEKMEEKERIHKKSNEIRRNMDGVVLEKYDNLEQRLYDFLDNYPIQPEAVKKEEAMRELQNSVSEDMKKEIVKAFSEYMEQINIYVQQAIGDERLQAQQFIGQLSDQLEDVNSLMVSKDGVRTACVVGVDALTNVFAVGVSSLFSAVPLMGLGGMLEGYRAVGAKGAATGLVGGVVVSSLAGAALVAATGAVGIIPFALITGIAGTMGGKLLTSAVWGKDIRQKKIDEIRVKLKKSGEEAVQNLREQRVLENWVQTQVEQQIDQLMEELDKEAESMISGTEDTLKSIAADIVIASQNKEAKLEECHRLEAKLKSINDRMIPIMEKVEAANRQLA